MPHSLAYLRVNELRVNIRKGCGGISSREADVATTHPSNDRYAAHFVRGMLRYTSSALPRSHAQRIKSQIENRSIVNSTIYPLPTHTKRPSLCGSNAPTFFIHHASFRFMRQPSKISPKKDLNSRTTARKVFSLRFR